MKSKLGRSYSFVHFIGSFLCIKSAAVLPYQRRRGRWWWWTQWWHRSSRALEILNVDDVGLLLLATDCGFGCGSVGIHPGFMWSIRSVSVQDASISWIHQFLRWMLLSLSFWDLLGFFFFGIFGGCHFSRSWDSLLMVKAFLISLGSATKFTWWMLLNLSFWDLLGFFWDSLGFHFSRNWDLLLMVKASLISLGSATKFTKWLLLIGSFSNL